MKYIRSWRVLAQVIDILSPYPGITDKFSNGESANLAYSFQKLDECEKQF